MPTAPAKRTYSSSRRALQAAQTRQDVVDAAIELFGSGGWAGTTLAAVAERAGVAVETVYKGFGSKKQLLRAALDVAVVGDVEPIPFVERPEFLALGEGTIEERVARGAALVRSIHARTAGVWQAILEASGADDEIAGWRIELERARRTDLRRSVERIVGTEVDEHTITLLWILYSTEAYLKLVGDGEMSTSEYESFLVEASHRLLITLAS